MSIDWTQLMATFAALAALMFGLVKWFASWAEKRHQEHEDRWERHDTEIEKLKSENRSQENSIRDTRERMHKEFVRQELFNDLKRNLRRDFDKMDGRFDSFSALVERIHERISGMAKDLNQLIGVHKGNGDME